MSKKDRLQQDITTWRAILFMVVTAFVTLTSYLYGTIKADKIYTPDIVIGVVLMALLTYFTVKTWNKMKVLSKELEEEE